MNFYFSAQTTMTGLTRAQSSGALMYIKYGDPSLRQPKDPKEEEALQMQWPSQSEEFGVCV